MTLSYGDMEEVNPSGRSTLIVDDDQYIRSYLRVMLGSLKISRIYEAGDGARAVRLNIEHKPDLILLDINLPDSDGLELLETLRGDNPMCQVVMVSGEATSNRVATAIKAGVSGFIAKPFNTNTVVKTIAAALGPYPE